jgi:[ribosomal protein S5]-alanine N-acetyltransferase
VVLREPIMSDFPAWQSLRMKNRTFLEPWEPTWDEQDLTRSSFRERLAQYKRLSDADQAYAYFIFNAGEATLCGALTLSNVRRGVAQMGTVGYWIAQEFSRQGLMTDALRTLTRHAFTDLRLHRVEAACLPRNEGSIRLLERCGFEREGYARDYLQIAGRWEDHLLYAKVDHTRTSSKLQS